MKRSNKWLFPLALVTGILLVFWYFCASGKQNQNSVPAAPAAKATPVAKTFSELRTDLVRANASSPEEAAVKPVPLSPKETFHTEVGVSKAVEFYARLHASAASRCEELHRETVQAFVAALRDYLSALEKKAHANPSTPEYRDADEAIKDFLGFLPTDVSQKEWEMLWYRTMTFTPELQCAGGNRTDELAGLSLSAADFVRSHYGPKLIQGLDSPDICMRKVKEETLRQGTSEWAFGKTEWTIYEYDLNLEFMANRIYDRSGARDYYLFLQRYFPYGNFDLDDVYSTLHDVANSTDLSQKEKEFFFRKINGNAQAINRAAKQLDQETPFTVFDLADFQYIR